MVVETVGLCLNFFYPLNIEKHTMYESNNLFLTCGEQRDNF
jgi:hypothetical protein